MEILGLEEFLYQGFQRCRLLFGSQVLKNLQLKHPVLETPGRMFLGSLMVFVGLSQCWMGFFVYRFYVFFFAGFLMGVFGIDGVRWFL